MRRRNLGIVVFMWSGLLAAAVLFLAFQGRRTLFLRLEVAAPGPGVGEIWWTAHQRPFSVADSISFPLAGGAQPRTVTVAIPVEVDSLQIRPGRSGGGETVVQSIELATPFATLRRWDREHGFAGWHAVAGLDGFRLADGALRMRVTAADGAFQVDDIEPLRDGARRRGHLRLALLGGLLAGLLQSAALLLLIGSRTGRQAAEPRAAPATGPARGGRPAWPAITILVVTVAICLPLGWTLSRRLAQRGAPPVFNDTGEYSLVFVDHLGRRLSERDGSLRLALDPYSLYRNAPDQRTRKFNLDVHGYRGGFVPGDPRPRVLFLGGSAAFGFGLASDAEVYTAQLAALLPRDQMVNAAAVGFLSGQELAELVYRGPAVAPAAVVVVDGWNDLNVPLLAATRFPFAGLPVGFNWDVFQLVENRLRLLTLGGTAEAPVRQDREAIPELVERITATYIANLIEMKRVAAGRGIPFLVVLQPCVSTRRVLPAGERPVLAQWTQMGERGAPELYAGLLAATRKALAEQGIPFVDANAVPAFADGGAPLFLDMVHPNAAGHRELAAAIQGPLRALLADR